LYIHEKSKLPGIKKRMDRTKICRGTPAMRYIVKCQTP
jgi:hypothetical protein